METIEIKENDTIVVKVDCNGLTKSQADIKRELIASEIQLSHRDSKVLAIDSLNDILLIPDNNSTIIISVDVGNLPRSKADQYVKDCATYVKSVVPNKEVLGIPNTCSVYLIPSTDGIIAASVDVGNLPISKSHEYLTNIGKVLKDIFPSNKRAIHPKYIEICTTDTKNFTILVEPDASVEHIKNTINDLQKLNPDINYSFKFKE